MTAKGESWTWRVPTNAGDVVESAVADRTFPSQSDAESWLGESWQELADDGVEQVVLVRDDQVIYGPMSLDVG